MTAASLGNEKDETSDVVQDVLEDGPHPDLHIDPKEEKKLVRRIDAYVISILGLLYLMCFLDRGNIGSANVATPSMSQSLGLTPQQYGAAVSVVYSTYVVFEAVWSNLLKIVGPKLLLSASTTVWGVLTICTTWAGSYAHIMIIRVLLGVFEAGLFPCVTMYVMMTYRREETGQRMSYIFVCAAISGAVGGLIAYGLVHIESGNLVGWQYLYLVEGIISLILAPITYFWIPNRIDEAWFLNAEQKRLAAVRYEINKAHYNHKEQFQWSEVLRGITDWKTYVSGTIQFCADVTLYGISTFMPQLIKAMGYSNVNAQLLTVPVYIFGSIVFLVMAYFSDKYRTRSPFIIFGFSMILIGYIILATVDAVGGRYFSLFLIAGGLYNIPGLNVVWISNNTAGHYKRATAVGLNQLIGNSSGAAIGSIFLSTLAPRYFQSIYICMGLTALGLFMTCLQVFLLRRVNAKRAEMVKNGALDQPELGDANPHFKYWL